MKHQMTTTACPVIRLDHQQVARIAHEALRSYCLTVYDNPAPPWADAHEQVRAEMVALVGYLARTPGATPRSKHGEWLADATARGFHQGERLDVRRKTHPLVVPFEELSPKYRSKQAMLFALITHLLDPSTGC